MLIGTAEFHPIAVGSKHGVKGAHLKRGDSVAGLVGLEMADEVPTQGRRAIGNFEAGFLDAVLAEELNAETGEGADGRRRVILADGHQLHRSRIAIRAEAGIADAALDLFQVPGKVHARSVPGGDRNRKRESRGWMPWRDNTGW